MMACGGVWISLEEGRPGGVPKKIPICELPTPSDGLVNGLPTQDTGPD